ncbi:MAG TPA: amidohydrolase family protein [Thermoplasmata archaeon]|nr:amidohydrolase family protein [Thermoplasmata archaeon]
MRSEAVDAVAGAEEGTVDAHIHLTSWWPGRPGSFHRPDLAYDWNGLRGELDAARASHAIAIQMWNAPDAASAIEEGHRFAEESEGRLLPVVAASPLWPEAQLRDAVLRWRAEPRLSGIKLYPGYEPFYPTDPRLGPVLDFAADRGVPVLIHQGDTLLADGLVKFARPIEVDELAVARRDVTFVLCHLGNPWVEETAEVVYKNENVYTDTSGLVGPPGQTFFAAQVRRAGRRLANALDAIGHADRVLFGSDWPLESVETALSVLAGVDLPTSDRRKILRENGRRLFRVPP